MTFNNGMTDGIGGYYLADMDYSATPTAIPAVGCDAGWYCPFGLLKRYPCPAGHYCPAGADLPTPCSAGYFNIHIMQTDATACTNNPCPTGYYCNIGTKYP